MQDEIHAALDRAEKDDAGAVVIAGNQKVFPPPGSDLSVLRGDDPDAALDMLARAGSTFPCGCCRFRSRSSSRLHRARGRDGVVPARSLAKRNEYQVFTPIFQNAGK